MSAGVSTPCRFRARAWFDELLVADSTHTVRVDHDDLPSELFFPSDEVRADLLPPSALTPGRGELAGLVAFDPDAVRVELVDGGDGDDPRDVTIKRFPTWGDAADLVALLDVAKDGDARFVGQARREPGRAVVEGSQLLGQSIVAACRLVPGRRPVAASMVFTRAADARATIDFELDEITNGRTFTTYAARALQGGRICATGTLLLDETAPEVIAHSVEPPHVPGPYESEPYDMFVTGRDLRIVDGAYTGDPDAPVGPPVLDAWLRFRDLPDDEAIHAGLLAQFTGHLSIAAALRPHAGVGEAQAHRSLSTAINAISLSIHQPVHADRWLLYRHLSTRASAGMTHAECRVHDEDGMLVASFTVDAMVRPFGDPSAANDERRAL